MTITVTGGERCAGGGRRRGDDGGRDGGQRQRADQRHGRRRRHDADGDAWWRNATNGTVTLASDGSFTYTPAANFNGTDSFTYTASDGTAVSNVATVTITVTAVNDEPLAMSDSATIDGEHGGQHRGPGERQRPRGRQPVGDGGDPARARQRDPQRGRGPSRIPRRPITVAPTPSPTRWPTVAAAPPRPRSA